MVMQTMVLKVDTGSGMQTMRLGASLRDRATLPSPLRGLGPSGGYPSRLRSLRSLRAPLAAAVRCAHRRCRTGTPGASFHRTVHSTAASSSLRRCASRSSRCSPRSPWPASPAAGIASARCRRAARGAGAGFAVHRLAHRAVHHPKHRCLRSCARSCGARPHFAPHHAVHWCPHKCGYRRRHFRRRAPHVLPQYPRRSRPLKRRGGSDEPRSPATISRTLMQQAWPSRPPGAALGLTPDASVMHGAQGRACGVFNRQDPDPAQSCASLTCRE